MRRSEDERDDALRLVTGAPRVFEMPLDDRGRVLVLSPLSQLRSGVA